MGWDLVIEKVSSQTLLTSTWAESSYWSHCGGGQWPGSLHSSATLHCPVCPCSSSHTYWPSEWRRPFACHLSSSPGSSWSLRTTAQTLIACSPCADTLMRTASHSFPGVSILWQWKHCIVWGKYWVPWPLTCIVCLSLRCSLERQRCHRQPCTAFHCTCQTLTCCTHSLLLLTAQQKRRADTVSPNWSAWSDVSQSVEWCFAVTILKFDFSEFKPLYTWPSSRLVDDHRKKSVN